MSAPIIRIGGTQSNAIASTGELKVSWRFPLGCWEASWSMGLKPLQQPPALRRDEPVTITVGGVPVWAGDFDEPNWSESTFSAAGAARSAESALCLKSDGRTTTIPDEAVDEAFARGMLTFERGQAIQSTPFGPEEETAELNYVAAMLDAWADENETSWTVTPARRLVTATDPTTPMWHVVPGAAELGIATETLAGRIVGLWQDSGGKLHRTAVGEGRPEVPVDLTRMGAITQTRATNTLNRILAKAGPAAGSWSNQIELTREQITTPGGVQPHLGQVGASFGRGAMVRLLGHPDPRTDDRAYAGRQYTDVIIEAAEWDVAAGTLLLTPRGYADRDLSTIVENSGGELVSV